MSKIQESMEPTANETENIIQECRERIWQALEADGSKLRERTELESNEILARAREEADKAIAQAKHEASVVSERIIALAKEEAEQIVKSSREEALKAKQESARMINETRLLTQVSQSVEQIIGETGEQVKNNLERLSAIIAEAKSTLHPMNQTEIKEEIIQIRETEEKLVPKVALTEKTEPAISPDEDRRSNATRDIEDTFLFQGHLKLEIIRPFDQERLTGVPEWLVKMSGIKVTSTGCYARANRWISMYAIDLAQPMPLLKIFNAMPLVKEATEQRGSVVITLK